MSGYNNVVIAGNLGQDAETRTTPQGESVVSFSVAVNRGSGENAHTEWVPCVFWGERAVKLATHLTKGKRLIVEGRWQTRTWQDNGGPRAKTELIVSDVAFNGYNRVTVCGNLGADAELFYSGEGKPYLRFRLAANTGWGEHQRTEWVSAVMFGQRAEAIAPYMTQGAAVLVSGEMRTSTWETDTGEKRRKTEVVVAPYHGEITFMGGKKQRADADAAANADADAAADADATPADDDTTLDY